MIVKNEQDTLPNCLESVKNAVDEIIIVDTGSSDATKSVAKKYTDRIYDFLWIDDFSAARNFSFSKGTGDYLFWLDADDIISTDDCKKLMDLKKSLSPSTDIVMMKYHTGFDSSGAPTFSYYRERLIKRSLGLRWEGAIHEAIVPVGNILYSDVAIRHAKVRSSDPGRNLRIFEKLLSKNKELSPREQFYYGRELFYHGRYQDAIDVLERFLDEGRGWLENNISACQNLADCYYAQNKPSQALIALLRSFTMDAPRAEICCEIGRHFLSRQMFSIAAHWYETALCLPIPQSSSGFISPDCYGYLPAIQLCICYDHMGNLPLAQSYNELAGHYKPTDAAYLYNREYFERKLGK